MKLSADYIAGFFDGEGCVSFNRLRQVQAGREYFILRVTIAQKHRRILDILQRQLKIGTVSQIRRENQYNHRWIVQRLAAAQFLRLIQGRVVIKHKQVEAALKAFDSGLPASKLSRAYWQLRRLKRQPH